MEAEGFAAATELPAGEDYDAALGDSFLWTARLFSDAAFPYAHARVLGHHRATEHTSDALRYAFDGGEHALVVIETRSFAFVRVDDVSTRSLAPAERGPRIRALADTVLRTHGLHQPTKAWQLAPYEWHFQLPANIREGMLFSTANVDPSAIASWADRADGGVRGDRVFFVLYKFPRRPAYEANKLEDRWFDGAWRRGRYQPEAPDWGPLY